DWARHGRTAGAAVIRDRRERTISAVLRVHGRGFALNERDEQEQLLQQWGDALATFCAERGPVGRIRWLEWAGPTGLDDQLAYLAEHYQPADVSHTEAYHALLDHAGPKTTRHDALVVVTVEDRRLRLRRNTDIDKAAEAEQILMEELRLLTSRLDAAGLVVDAPLSPSEVAHVWRSRLDPFHAPGVGTNRRRSLVELAGLVSVANAGPLSLRTERDHVQVDSAVHAAYVIAEWPRLDVPPGWMEPLLLHAGGIRTVAVHYEPVAPSRSRRAIDRDTVKLAADEEQRTRSGFRIGARHHRARADVWDREAELVAGYAEFEYVGFVVVTARDIEQLERSCSEYEQAAAQTGLELRRLDGRHDLALACMLPMGRGLATRRFQ
ncbi:MAG: SCO6880 family protein, partial [Acidimicrobiia bacterium]